jgi:nucleotide-binding universal stress UspA family protein
MSATRSIPSTTSSRRIRARRVKTIGGPQSRFVALGLDAPRRVLLATDGSVPASAAMRLARAMAERNAWSPDVLSVVQPVPVSVGEVLLPAPPIQYDVTVTDSIGNGIRGQLKRYGDRAWPLEIEYGRAVPVIAETARTHGSTLIVLGLGRHGRLARLLGAETAARVIRHADVPVLAVDGRVKTPPHLALAAVDFGESSVRAAREALALIEPPGLLHLVHVKWTLNTTSFDDAEWERAYAAGADAEFARLKAALGPHPGIRISTALLTGGVVEKVLNEAEALGAELIAVGSHNQTVFDRMLIGSTPAQVLRAARCSVLVAPPARIHA